MAKYYFYIHYLFVKQYKINSSTVFHKCNAIVLYGDHFSAYFSYESIHYSYLPFQSCSLQASVPHLWMKKRQISTQKISYIFTDHRPIPKTFIKLGYKSLLSDYRSQTFIYKSSKSLLLFALFVPILNF